MILPHVTRAAKYVIRRPRRSGDPAVLPPLSPLMVPSAAAVAATASASLLLFVLHQWVHVRQPHPYMDELFHVPQAEELCRAVLARRLPRYDPAITTPPGLYLPAAVAALLVRSHRPCTTRALRLSSAACTFLCLPLLVALLRALRRRRRARICVSHPPPPANKRAHTDTDAHTQRRRVPAARSPPPQQHVPWPHSAVWAVAAALWLNPVLVFFAQLFYTDPAASFWLLATAALAAAGGVAPAANAGICGAIVRQTNVVWHFFCAADAVLHDEWGSAGLGYGPDSDSDSDSDFDSHTRESKSGDGAHEQAHRAATRTNLALKRERAWQWACSVVHHNTPHIVAAVAYIAFFLCNGGVALGDRARHTATVHHAMLPYLLGFHALSYLPLQLATPATTARALRALLSSRRALLALGAIAAVVAALVEMTGPWAHAFVLADNRHLPFHVHRRWLRRSSRHRLALVPLYLWTPATLIGEHVATGSAPVERVSDAMLFLCAAAVLIPSPLLEPRYFVAPSLLLAARRASRIEPHPSPRRVLALAVVPLVLANILLVYVFTELPFDRPRDAHMPTDISPGRFML